MDKIYLENFRCFHKLQVVPLSPLTLLVGENSTGKTSFLGLVNALSSIPFMNLAPDFKRVPYDLGSFDEIAHHRGPRGNKAVEFSAGFESFFMTTAGNINIRMNFIFTKEGTAPFPMKRGVSIGGVWGIEEIDQRSLASIRIGTNNGQWETSQLPSDSPMQPARNSLFIAMQSALGAFAANRSTDYFTPVGDSPQLSENDREVFANFFKTLVMFTGADIPISIAPVRSSPRRTYNPSRVVVDPEGDFVPMWLAEMAYDDPEKWVKTRESLEQFGKNAGLFDDIRVKRLGKSGSDPFQLQVRKHDGRYRGPWRNMADVGYGVSQILPIVTEILQGPNEGLQRTLFLLQQPEVHLHPSAQAALGSLFCQVASPKKQLIVETHSDHLIDRIRMDIRDGRSALKPEDVTVLYFERNGQEVDIHPIRFDELGNVLDAPPSYRRFFMEEVTRSIWGGDTADVS